MKRYPLIGIDAFNNHARISADVVAFTGHNEYFRITCPAMGELTLITPKGSYPLKRHTQLNIFQGTCDGVKVHVSLKKIVGELRYWPKGE